MTAAVSRRSEAPVVDIQVASMLWEAVPQAEQTVREALGTTADMLATPGGEVSIVLTDDAAIRTLNRDWRGIDKATNVLSFPAPKVNAGSPAMLGDIVIAYETLARECADEDKIFLHHLAHLTVHGFLHLLGYDHETDAQADEMEGLEAKIMSALKMPDPYFGRDLGSA